MIVKMQKGNIRVVGALDKEERFSGLRILGVEPISVSAEDLLDTFRKLEGEISLLVQECENEGERDEEKKEGETETSRRVSSANKWKDTLALQPDKPMAVGSSFKLYVLKALAADILQGKRSWRDVVELHESDKSLSAVDLQDWPAGAPVTLFSLAASMIAKSDNSTPLLPTPSLASLLPLSALCLSTPIFPPFPRISLAFSFFSPSPLKNLCSCHRCTDSCCGKGGN